MKNIKNPILERLLRRRALLKKQLSDALAAPASYSIQGSYSETLRTPDDIRAELNQLDNEIQALCIGNGPQMTYPRYV